MKCKESKALYDTEWFHQLMWEAHGSNPEVPREDYSEYHLLSAKMAGIMESRIKGKEETP